MGDKPRRSDNMDDLPNLKRRGLSLKLTKTKYSEPQLRRQAVKDCGKFVGLDVHKETIAVFIAQADGVEVCYFGEIKNTPEANSSARYAASLAPAGSSLTRRWRCKRIATSAARKNWGTQDCVSNSPGEATAQTRLGSPMRRPTRCNKRSRTWSGRIQVLCQAGRLPKLQADR